MNDHELPGLTLFVVIVGMGAMVLAFALLFSGCVNGKPDARTIARRSLDAAQIACILERAVELEALRLPCELLDEHLEEARKLVGVRDRMIAAGALRVAR
jgi:hypothetical protein